MSYKESIADMRVVVKTNLSNDKNVLSCYPGDMDALKAMGAYLQEMREDCRVPIGWVADANARNIGEIRHTDEIAPQDKPRYRKLVQKDIAVLLGEDVDSGTRKVTRWETGTNEAGVEGFFRFLSFVGGSGDDIVSLFGLKNPTENDGTRLAQLHIEKKYKQPLPSDEDVVDAYTVEELDRELERITNGLRRDHSLLGRVRKVMRLQLAEKF